MSVGQRDVTVTVRHSGKVEVNGVLVAEVAVGEVIGRDELAENLTLHRVSHVLLEVVQAATAALAKVSGKDRDSVAAGLVDGLLDVTVPYPGHNPGGQVPPIPPRHDRQYRSGYEFGGRLRRLTVHLERAAEPGG